MIAILTDAGSIELEAASGDCVRCSRKGGGMVQVSEQAVGEPDRVFLSCGECIGAAFFYAFPRATDD